jgi:hypothetical protein
MIEEGDQRAVLPPDCYIDARTMDRDSIFKREDKPDQQHVAFGR